MISPYLRMPLRSLSEVKGEKPLPMIIRKLPDTGNTLWLTEDAFYEPTPIRRSTSRTYVAAFLCGAIIALAFLILPLVEWLGGL